MDSSDNPILKHEPTDMECTSPPIPEFVAIIFGKIDPAIESEAPGLSDEFEHREWINHPEEDLTVHEPVERQGWIDYLSDNQVSHEQVDHEAWHKYFQDKLLPQIEKVEKIRFDLNHSQRFKLSWFCLWDKETHWGSPFTKAPENTREDTQRILTEVLRIIDDDFVGFEDEGQQYYGPRTARPPAKRDHTKTDASSKDGKVITAI